MRAVADGAYANLEMPAVLRRHRLEGRDAALRHRARLRHDPLAGLLRRRGRRGGGPAHLADRPPGARRAAARVPPAARDARGHPRRRRPDGRLWPARWPERAPAASSTPSCGASANARSRSGARRSCPRAGSRGARGALQPSRVGRHRPAGGAAGARRGPRRARSRPSSRRCSRPTTRQPQVHLVARPGLSTVDELVAAGDVERSTVARPSGRSCSPGTPAPSRRCGTAGRPSRTRAPSSWPSPSPRRRRRPASPRGGSTSARAPVARPGLLGSAGRPGRRRPRRANEVSQHRADLVRSTLRPVAALAARKRPQHRGAHGGRARRRGGRARRHTAGFSSTPPAPGSGRCGGVRRRGGDDRPPTSPSWPRCSVPCSPRPSTRWRPVGSSGMPPAVPTWPRPGSSSATSSRGGRTWSSPTHAPLFTDAAGAPLEALGEGPFVQLWPHVHGTDAMFFALLRRR